MRLWLAILAGLQVVSGGSALMEVWDRKWVGLFVLVVAAAQAGTVVYMKSEETGRHHVRPRGARGEDQAVAGVDRGTDPHLRPGPGGDRW